MDKKLQNNDYCFALKIDKNYRKTFKPWLIDKTRIQKTC